MTSREHRELAKVLGGFPAFAQCSSEDLVALARAGRVTTLPAHWVFLHEGTPADACYVLLEGQAQVRLHGHDRDVLGPGAVLGEMALLSRSLRTASVVTVAPMRALRVEYLDLVAVLDARPQLRASVFAVFDDHRGPDAAAGSSSPSVT